MIITHVLIIFIIVDNFLKKMMLITNYIMITFVREMSSLKKTK